MTYKMTLAIACTTTYLAIQAHFIFGWSLRQMGIFIFVSTLVGTSLISYILLYFDKKEKIQSECEEK